VHFFFCVSFCSAIRKSYAVSQSWVEGANAFASMVLLIKVLALASICLFFSSNFFFFFALIFSLRLCCLAFFLLCSNALIFASSCSCDDVGEAWGNGRASVVRRQGRS